jgi:hypothetical protein
MLEKQNNIAVFEDNLINELAQIIEQSQRQIAVQANSALTILFWHIGNHINQNVLQYKRADYAKRIVPTV